MRTTPFMGMVTVVFNPICDIGNEVATTRFSKVKEAQKDRGKGLKLQGNLLYMWKLKDESNNDNKMNMFWGDNTDDKDESDLRITSCNINGLSDIEELSQYIIGALQ